MLRPFHFSSSSVISILLPILLENFNALSLCQKSYPSIQEDAILGHHQSANRRTRRTPAVWGDPPPDYSEAQLEGGQTYLYALLFVDLKISDHYRRDHERVKAEVMKLAGEANKYFYQINLRLIIVDILETMKPDLSLYSFEDYRNKRLHQLPFHNFAVLLSYRYAGGLAFVGGLCSAKSVMLTGFYPHNPEAMGSIFFHEVGHLIGVPHHHPNETLNVPNCACNGRRQESGSIYRQPYQPRQLPSVQSNGMPPPKHNEFKDALTEKESLNKFITNLSRQELPDRSNHCLRIPGFDHDCTLQLMANLVYRNRCLSRELRSSTQQQSAQEGYLDGLKLSSDDDLLKSIALCGNGVKEDKEQCDCGIEKFCSAWNCNANTCTRPVPLWIVIISSIVISVALVAPAFVYFYMHLCGHYSSSSMLSPCLMHSTSLSFKHRSKFMASNGLFFSSSSSHQSPYYLPKKQSTMKSPIQLLVQTMSYIKQKFVSRNQLDGSNIRARHSFRFSPAHSTTKSSALNPLSSILVLHNSAASILPFNYSQRLVSPPEQISCPAKIKRPRRPPPPPPCPRLNVGSPTHSHISMNLKINSLSRPNSRPKVPPPSLPHSLRPKKGKETARDQSAVTYSSMATSSKLSSPSQEEKNRYSISHKFADFDDEEYDSDFDENFAPSQD